MKAEFWVLVAAEKLAYGARDWQRSGTPKVSISKPHTRANEVAVKIAMEVPDNYFEKPQLSATIVIPEGGKTRSELVAEVGEEAAQLLKAEFGLTVNFIPEDRA